jgi:hypothetical protein
MASSYQDIEGPVTMVYHVRYCPQFLPGRLTVCLLLFRALSIPRLFPPT